MLELRNIVKDYEAGDTVVRALKGVDITFRKSEFVSILGPSGCGKTTLLNIVGGLDRYTCGDLIINGRSTRSFREYDWDAYRNNCVGFVFQNYNLIPHLSVLGNVELALTLSGESKSTRRKKAQAALEKVGLGSELNKKPNQLSGGQMQRVAIARAIVNDPEIILADEPTGALDSKNSVQIADLLKEISKDRLIIMVTHNDTLAADYSTRIIKFLDGEKVSDSDPYEPSQEERLQEIKAEREAHNEAFLPEEYAPEVYPDPATPLVSKRKKNKKSGKDAAQPAMQEKTEAVEKPTVAQSEVPPLDKKAAKQKAKEEKKARKEELRRRKKEMKSTSMNFFTAMGLSGRNLATKKGRTALVSFAGSIGIIGIALVLSISNGFTNYIDKLQTDTLASFPIQITQRTVDVASLTSMVGGSGEKHKEFPTDGKVEVYTKNISSMLYYNDITDEYISYIKDMNPAWSKGVAYTNSVNMFILRKDKQNNAQIIDTESSSNSLISSSSLWQEMLPTPEYMEEQYEVMAGKMPTSANEVALVIDKNNRISTTVLEGLGLSFSTGKIDLESLLPSHDEPNKPDYILIANDNLYPDGEYKTKFSQEELNTLYTTEGEAGEKNIPINIVGVLRIQKGIPIEMFNTGLVYTPALTQAVLAMNGNSKIAEAQRAQLDLPLNESKRVTDDKPFYSLINDLTQETLELDKLITQYEEDMDMTLDEMLKQYPGLKEIPALEPYYEQIVQLAAMRSLIKDTIKFYQNQAMERLGAATRPSAIFIYPKDFENKKHINKYLDAYNKKHPDNKVMYTDASELLASTMGNMVNIISYVLIAFAAVSLVVSSIMIAIITYSSVIERTKEIGVLRSIGARKKDISRVFNAETVLIGFIAGLIGVLIAFLLTFPINAIIGAVINANGGGSLGIGNLASLHPLHALMLVCVSIVLTLISGFIPSRMAAKKDPVTALRTE